MNSTCIIYVCHVVNDESIKRFNKLYLNEYDTYWLYINDKIPSQCNIENFVYQIPDSGMFETDNPNMIFNYLDFFNTHNQYKYYWFIEYDVIYTGEFENFIKEFANNNSDFLGINLHHKIVWDKANYNIYKQQLNKNFDTNSIILQMGPVMRISNELFMKLNKFFEENVNLNPFFDFIIPSIAYINNMKIEEIGGNSEDFGVKERLNRYYTRTNQFYNLTNNDNVRVNPIFTQEEYNQYKNILDKLLHPVKIDIIT